jgi:hypothetical protein
MSVERAKGVDVLLPDVVQNLNVACLTHFPMQGFQKCLRGTVNSYY